MTTTYAPPARGGLDKVVASAAEAVADIPDGASLAVGGSIILPSIGHRISVSPYVGLFQQLQPSCPPWH